MPVGRKPGYVVKWRPSAEYGSMAKNIEIPPSPCESKSCDRIDYKRCEDKKVMCKAFNDYVRLANNNKEDRDKKWMVKDIGIFKDIRCNHCHKVKKNCELKCENWRA